MAEIDTNARVPIAQQLAYLLQVHVPHVGLLLCDAEPVPTLHILVCCSPTERLTTPHHLYLSLRSQYNGVWHCFVGRNFGAYMTHEQGHNVYFYLGQMAVLLFKTG